MFNKEKKYAKRMSWHFLRKAQRLAMNSNIGQNPKFDTRKLMVSLGALGIYYTIESSSEGIATSQIDRFLEYLYPYADRDIYSLLSELRLVQLEKGTFRTCYTEMVQSAIKTESENESRFNGACFFAFIYAIKDEYLDDDLSNIEETEASEFFSMVPIECEMHLQ